METNHVDFQIQRNFLTLIDTHNAYLSLNFFSANDRTLIFRVRLYCTVLPYNVRSSSNSSYPKIRGLRFEPITLNDWVSSMFFFWKINRCSCWTVQPHCMAELFGNCMCKILAIFFFTFLAKLLHFDDFWVAEKKFKNLAEPYGRTVRQP